MCNSMNAKSLNKKILKELKTNLIEKYGDDIEKVILFGSRVHGNPREYSDYDISARTGHP